MRRVVAAIAIDRIDILSATSVFGLNALGGAAAVTMKNGFTYHGFDGTLSGGSFNQREAQAEYGVNCHRSTVRDGYRPLQHCQGGSRR
jgi:iron complex outermembrane recepter protein